jgi:hypothetical protein
MRAETSVAIRVMSDIVLDSRTKKKTLRGDHVPVSVSPTLGPSVSHLPNISGLSVCRIFVKLCIVVFHRELS